jgi:hypothetical protein
LLGKRSLLPFPIANYITNVGDGKEEEASLSTSILISIPFHLPLRKCPMCFLGSSEMPHRLSNLSANKLSLHM